MIITAPSLVLAVEVDGAGPRRGIEIAVHTLTKTDTRATTAHPVHPAAPRNEARVLPITSTTASPRWALTIPVTAAEAATGSAVGTTITAVDHRPLVPTMARIPTIAELQVMIPDVDIGVPRDGAIKRYDKT